MRALEAIAGPLAVPECLRVLRSGRMFLSRTIFGIIGAGTLLVVLWICWFYSLIYPNFLPGHIFLTGLMTLEQMALSATLLLCPAMLAGILSKEKERGTLDLLLIAKVSPGEIVRSKMASRLCSMALLLLAGLPALTMLAGYCSISLTTILLLIALPLAVAFGSGGLSLAISATLLKSRDALLTTYILGFVLILMPGFWWPWASLALWSWIVPLNPFLMVAPTIHSGEYRPVLDSIGMWCVLGCMGVWWASWRIGYVHLRSGDVRSPRKSRGRFRVPPVSEDPVLWKELHIEQAVGFGRAVRWIGLAVGIVFLGGMVLLSAYIGWFRWSGTDPRSIRWSENLLRQLTFYSVMPLCWLMQWTIGLRASTTVASERQRQTWDTLLVSPLEGREIILAKLRGTLHGFRWILVAVLVAWCSSLSVGFLERNDFLYCLSHTIIVGFFMAAVGVWASLLCSTTTRAMTVTIGAWLAASVASAVVAYLIVALVAGGIYLSWMLFFYLTGDPNMMQRSPFPPSISFGGAWTVVRMALYATAGGLITWYCQSRFDRLVGRSKSRSGFEPGVKS